MAKSKGEPAAVSADDSAHTQSPRQRLAINLFIAAQIGVPIVATVYHWLTGVETWFGWQMFSK